MVVHAYVEWCLSEGDACQVLHITSLCGREEHRLPLLWRVKMEEEVDGKVRSGELFREWTRRE